MPASVLSEMNSHSGGLEDQRPMHLLAELSMLGINPDEDGSGSPTMTTSSYNTDDHKTMKKSANMTECVPVPSSEHVAEIVGRQGCKIKALRAKTNTYIKTPVRGEEPVFVVTGRKEDVGAAKREILSAAEHFSQIRASRRQNGNPSTPLSNGPPSPNTPGQVTIQVRVPYRVVGLVVGPKGATIKRIQQQTHTYIVTPSRDKEPVFEVTGSAESVEKARQEIESHIAMRTGGLVDANNANHVPCNSESVDAHLNQINDFHTSAFDSSAFHGDMGCGDLLASIYKPPSSNSAFSSYISSLNNSSTGGNNQRDIFAFPPLLNGTSNGFSNGFSGALYDNDEGIGSPSYDTVPPAALSSVWSDNFNVFGNVLQANSNVMTRRSSSLSSSTTPRLSPTLTDSSAGSSSANGGLEQHSQVRRIRSDPLNSTSLPHAGGCSNGGPPPNNLPNNLPPAACPPAVAANVVNGPLNGPPCFSTSSVASSSNCTSPSSGSPPAACHPPPKNPASTTSPNSATTPAALLRGPRGGRHCLVCTESEVVAALVPCGHNLFCMECANLIVEKAETDRRCPVCQQTPTQAIRIFS